MKSLVSAVLLLMVSCSVKPTPATPPQPKSGAVAERDPETAIFASLREDLVGRYKTHDKNDLLRQIDAGSLAMLDSLEVTHNSIAKNNREHPDHPEVDVLDFRKQMFGR